MKEPRNGAWANCSPEMVLLAAKFEPFELQAMRSSDGIGTGNSVRLALQQRVSSAGFVPREILRAIRWMEKSRVALYWLFLCFMAARLRVIGHVFFAISLSGGRTSGRPGGVGVREQHQNRSTCRRRRHSLDVGVGAVIGVSASRFRSACYQREGHSFPPHPSFPSSSSTPPHPPYPSPWVGPSGRSPLTVATSDRI